MDFGSLPPEINSARIYAGPGSAPMLAAAAAWGKMAAELGAAEAAYQSVIDGLVSEGWMGPASTAMAAAAAPYAAWMGATAAQAHQTATQAQAAAAAYEAARAMTVPPPVIVANRSQLAMLVASNFLGQNTAAIALNEAHYGQMWAQDAAAMYGYAASSAAAAKVSLFSPAREVANPNAQATQGAAVNQAGGSAASAGAQSALAQVVTNTPSTLQSLSAPLQSGVAAPTTGTATPATPVTPGTVIGDAAGYFGLQPGDVSNMLSNFMSSSVSPMSMAGITQVGADIAVIRGAALAAADPLGLGAIDPLDMLLPHLGGGLGGGLGAGLGGLHGLGGGLGGVGAASAAVGQASSIGALSVPHAWAAAAPVAGPAAGLTPATGWTVAAHAPEAGAAGMPGVPMAGAGAGRGYGFAAPRYGFKPTVMARPVAAG